MRYLRNGRMRVGRGRRPPRARLAAALVAALLAPAALFGPVAWAQAPAIDTIQPTAGPPGTALTLTGSGFENPGSVAGAVYFTPAGGTAVTAAGSGWSDTSLTVDVPQSLPAGTVAVAVYNATTGTLSQSPISFTVTQTALVAGDSLAFNPSTYIATPGTLPASGSVDVALLATDASNTPIADATVYLSIDAGASGQASVGGTPLTSIPVSFTTDANGQLTVTYTTPAVLPTGVVDTITAASDASGAPAVSATDTYDYTSTTSAVAAPPTDTVPDVTGVSPTSGPAAGGTSVTVSGSGFTGASTVDFGSSAATAFSVDSDQEITATAPPGTGTVDVTVTTSYGTSTTSGADQFTYTAGTAPAVTAISPASGPAAGGTSVTVSGSGFTGASAVDFGSSAATAFNVDSDQEITATAPSGTGTVDVTVTTPYGTSAPSGADRFTYTGGTAPRFSDVPAGYWAAPQINQLAAAGVIDGFPDHTFRPQGAVTRAQFIKMLAVVLGLRPDTEPMPFRDVPKGAWFAPYVSAAVHAGIVQGVSATRFAPDATLTREEMAVLLARALKLTRTVALHFTDDRAIAAWAAPGVEEAVAAGYIHGFPNGSFQPLGTTTRAQAAAVLAAAWNHLHGNAGPAAG